MALLGVCGCIVTDFFTAAHGVLRLILELNATFFVMKLLNRWANQQTSSNLLGALPGLGWLGFWTPKFKHVKYL